MNLLDKFVFWMLNVLGIIKIFYSHRRLRFLLKQLPKTLSICLRQKGINKIVLLGIERSGIKLLTYLSKFDFSVYGIELLDTDTITISSYLNNTTNQTTPKLYKFVTEKTKATIRKNFGDDFAVILVDDMSDSGSTIKFTKDLLHKRFGKFLNVKYCLLTDKRTLEDKVFSPDGEIYAERINTNSFLVGFGSNFHDGLRDINFVFGVPKWFYKLLGKSKVLKNCFVTLIERYDDERSLCINQLVLYCKYE